MGLKTRNRQDGVHERLLDRLVAEAELEPDLPALTQVASRQVQPSEFVTFGRPQRAMALEPDSRRPDGRATGHSAAAPVDGGHSPPSALANSLS